jgi:MFS family permease
MNSSIVSLSLIISTGLAVFMGIIYDYFGRRVTIITNMAVLAMCLVLLPYMASSYGMIVLNRIVFSITTHFLYANPTVPDYVMPNSRAKAIANLQSIGQFAGEFFATVVLMSLTTIGDGWDYRLSFAFTAAFVLLFTIAAYFFVREKDETDDERSRPSVIEKRSENFVPNQEVQLTGYKKVCDMLK